MVNTKLIKTMYVITLVIVFSLVVIAVLANSSKFTGKKNILRYETVVFENNHQLKETICRNYKIDSRFDFLAEVKRINDISEDDDGFLGKPLIIPIIASN